MNLKLNIFILLTNLFLLTRCQSDLEKDKIAESESAENPLQNLACGKRKIRGDDLIVGGTTAKQGAWPWHVALNKVDSRNTTNYRCGGTLISQNIVLTAAHCVTEWGQKIIPQELIVTLGQYNLFVEDKNVQKSTVKLNIVHPNFTHTSLENDIALLELTSPVIFNDFIQPACLGLNKDKSISKQELYGTVVGWGIDKSGKLSHNLKELVMPKVNDITCLKSNPVFFDSALNGKKFCAGYHNVTHPLSVCNGDAGGGFMVFVPNNAGDKSPTADGAWHVIGLSSQVVYLPNEPYCDPTQYSVFTDVLPYLDWIKTFLI